ncbi:hypothetical protein O181_031536 [Austropuccinia psidii MF-1]|uniref:Uncharacterized protein n=1 Tax=Austropuccinia psidii MF-1 TaxID=1389203 RepID=A0A9Q3CV26_9BASI|nr:hypothetical protein [Austropuccinia psidii MF-1]
MPVCGRPIYSTSEVPISRIISEGVMKQIRKIAKSLLDTYAKVSDELDGEEVEVVLNSNGHHSSTSTSQPASKRFQSQLVPSTLRISNQSFPPFLLSKQVLPLLGLAWLQQ